MTEAARVLTGDTAVRLATGASVTLPRGWRIEPGLGGITVTAPEGDFAIRLIENEAGDTAEAAATAAWERLIGPPPPIRVAGDEPARDGWGAIRAIAFDPPPAARGWASAVGYRGAAGWTLALLDGASATFERRMAAAVLVMQSLRAPGFARESFAGTPPREFGAAEVEALRGFLAHAARRLAVPGIGLGVATRDRVLFAGGIGVRDVRRADPVTADTRFRIASNTKPLTTLLLAMLVDEGRVRWTDRVRDVYPAFRLGSPDATELAQIRHLVSASTGLPRADLAWSLVFDRATPASRTFDLLARTVPTSGFGEVYQYSNLLAAAAGFVAGRIAHPELDPGVGYDRAIQERVLDPLGMADTCFDLRRVRGGAFAAAHGTDLAGRPVASDRDLDGAIHALRPSGAAWSSVSDMLRYVRLELGEGMLDGKRLIGRDALLERREPFVTIGECGAYGMGLNIDRSGDVTVIAHGGSLPGAMSDFAILPEAGIAAVVLTNADNGQFLLPAFRRRLIELIYGAEPKAEAQIEGMVARVAAERRHWARVVRLPPPPSDAARLAVRYRSAEIGTLSVSQGSDGVAFRVNGLDLAVGVQRVGDMLAFVTIDPLLRGLTFAAETDAQGRVVALVLREAQQEYRFVRDGEAPHD